MNVNNNNCFFCLEIVEVKYYTLKETTSDRYVQAACSWFLFTFFLCAYNYDLKSVFICSTFPKSE